MKMLKSFKEIVEVFHEIVEEFYKVPFIYDLHLLQFLLYTLYTYTYISA